MTLSRQTIRSAACLIALSTFCGADRIGSSLHDAIGWKEAEIVDFTEYVDMPEEIMVVPPLVHDFDNETELFRFAEDDEMEEYMFPPALEDDFSDETGMFEEGRNYDANHRFEKTCGNNQSVFKVQFTTDGGGSEISYVLRRIGGGIAGSGPKNNRSFENNKSYTFSYCVQKGKRYTFKMKDKKKNGICCANGQGTYKLTLDGKVIFNSKRKRTFTNVGSHQFKVPESGSSGSNGNGQVSTSNTNPTSGKNSVGKGCVTVQITPDNNGQETSYSILNQSGAKVVNVPAGTFKGKKNSIKSEHCLPKGKYEFVIRDTYGDGMCCGSGKGSFRVFLDDAELFRGGYFKKEKRFTILVKFDQYSVMNARDIEYLDAHNARRKKYHVEFGGSYKPLRWSKDLARQSERWANALLVDCGKNGIKHEEGVAEGENLAKNVGTNGYMGQLYPADNILKRWVDNERYWGWPKNAHLTQALWSSSRYVGCGESAKPFKGGTCRIQVCRYARAGNCGMGSYNAGTGNNWMKAVMDEYTACGPDCPAEGCH